VIEKNGWEEDFNLRSLVPKQIDIEFFANGCLKSIVLYLNLRLSQPQFIYHWVLFMAHSEITDPNTLPCCRQWLASN
jgi:hypothetical protein